MNAPSPTRRTRRIRIAVAAALAATVACSVAAPAQAAPTDSIVAQPDAWGRYFVDAWASNSTGNTTPQSNVAIGLLSPMLEYWTPDANPTAQFDANGKFIPSSVGTIKNQAVLDANIATAAGITQSRTAEQSTQAYLIDRRNQNYSAINGLGPYADAFRAGTNAGTTIPDQIPTDATTVKYDDAGNSNGAWADSGTTYGPMVDLVNQFRNSAASTNPAKAYYNYARPFRWSDSVEVLPTLVPAEKTDAEWQSDGGYPSGHTNAGYLASYALAYAAPERFQQILTSASEIGNSRIVAGMHSPGDVIGGRIMSTAVAAAALNQPGNAALKQSARANAATLFATTPSGSDAFADRGSNEKLYEQRLTYGLPRVGDTTKSAVVPKGAEVLLETRQPYLSADQRRWVLQSTALPSGYALLDDSEGWGRLNLFAAADGYSAFSTDVTVDMNAADGGFSSADSWRNDIDGAGSLTKQGTGVLTLTGDNSYLGGTVVEGGQLAATSPTAFGTGSVSVAGGILSESATAPVVIGGNLAVLTGGELDLSIDSSAAAMNIAGNLAVAGKVKTTFANGFVPADDQVIATYTGSASNIDLASFSFEGLPAGYTPSVVLRDGAVHLLNRTPAAGDAAGDPGDSATASTLAATGATLPPLLPLGALGMLLAGGALIAARSRTRIRSEGMTCKGGRA
ncbi:phosphatase PAP2 family protein [Agreia pratensis]|uniref:Autotransporter-associated beta strand repeat-containing protein n=1 Tax=Agreia pratensis TaxID=150121 RepID=A0A1X7JNA3_9MICO|nr:phosphatase PAP2 family protein [Agreia pratensis]SMG29700.1 autotransporter-associated beta strand repeat-containing protein [Agreia pratensis]